MEVDAQPSACMLTADAMLMMYAGGAMWLWQGKALPDELRRNAFSMVDKLRFQNDLPQSAAVNIVKQGLEGPLFTQCFSDWDAVQQAALGEAKVIAVNGSRDGDGEKGRAVDLVALAKGGSEEEAMVDDGSGKKQVRRR
jgi:hypothetical protein